MIKVNSEEEKKALEGQQVAKGESQEADKSAKATVDAPLDTKEEMPRDSLQAIGHVPLPGSGSGKGTSVKK